MKIEHQQPQDLGSSDEEDADAPQSSSNLSPADNNEKADSIVI